MFIFIRNISFKVVRSSLSLAFFTAKAGYGQFVTDVFYRWSFRNRFIFDL